MVTAELSVAILAALVLLLTLCWGVYLVLMQMHLIDVAGEMARQAARGDRAGLNEARKQVPRRARVDVQVGRLTTVTVHLREQPLGSGLPHVALAARAVVATEPGVGP
jgi:hypothetical protein